MNGFVSTLWFQPGFLLVHPRFLVRRLGHKGLCSCTQVVAHMVEIKQVVVPRSKFVFYLIGYPLCPIAHGMNAAACAKLGLHGTLEELLSGGGNVALRGASIGLRLAPLGMCQADFCLLPLQLFAFAFVRLGGIWLYYPTL